MATGLSFWEVWLQTQGMSPADALSLDQRSDNIKYAQVLEREINDYYQSADKTRSKERLAYMRATLDSYAQQADVYTSLESIRGQDYRAELNAAQREVANYRNNVTAIAKAGSVFASRAEDAARKARSSATTGTVGATLQGLRAGLDHAGGVSPEGVDPGATIASQDEYYRAILEGSGATEDIEYDPATGKMKSTGTQKGNETIRGLKGTDLGNRLDAFGKSAHASEIRRSDAMGRLDSAKAGLGAITQEPGESMPDLQGRIAAARNDVKKAMAEVNDAYKFLDPETAKTWEKQIQEESAHVQRMEARLERMNQENFPEDLDLKHRKVIFANPEFLQWAAEKGYTRIGFVRDGEYFEGRHDDRLLREFNLEIDAGITPDGKPRYAWTFGGVPRPIEFIRYTAAVNPDDIELYRGANGDFFVETVVDPITGKQTKTYLTPEAYATAEKAAKTAGDAEIKSPWIRSDIEGQSDFYFVVDLRSKELYLVDKNSDEAPVAILPNEDGSYTIGDNEPYQFDDSVNWELVPVVESTRERTQTADPAIETSTEVGARYPTHAACGIGQISVMTKSGLRCVTPIGDPEVLKTLVDSPGWRNNIDDAHTAVQQVTHRMQVEEAAQAKRRVEELPTISDEEQLQESPEDRETRKTKEARKEEAARSRGGVFQRLVTMIAEGGPEDELLLDDAVDVVGEEGVVPEVDEEVVVDREEGVDVPPPADDDLPEAELPTEAELPIDEDVEDVEDVEPPSDVDAVEPEPEPAAELTGMQIADKLLEELAKAEAAGDRKTTDTLQQALDSLKDAGHLPSSTLDVTVGELPQYDAPVDAGYDPESDVLVERPPDSPEYEYDEEEEPWVADSKEDLLAAAEEGFDPAAALRAEERKAAATQREAALQQLAGAPKRAYERRQEAEAAREAAAAQAAEDKAAEDAAAADRERRGTAADIPGGAPIGALAGEEPPVGEEPLVDDAQLPIPETPTTADLAQDAAGVSPKPPESFDVTTAPELRGESNTLFDRWRTAFPQILKSREERDRNREDERNAEEDA